MKVFLAACFVVLITLSCAQIQPPTAPAEEPEQKFIKLGELVCEKHQKLGQVLVEQTEVFLGKFNDSGYRRAKESDMIVIFLCKDDEVFALRGANFDNLRAVEIPKQPVPQSIPPHSGKKPEVLL